MFITKLNADGSAPIFSTYLPAFLPFDPKGGVAVDPSGNILLTGRSSSRLDAGFPLVNPVQPPRDPNEQDTLLDAFVTKLNPSGNQLIYSTLLGGNNDDQGTAIAVDPQGNAFVTGSTLSINFPMSSQMVLSTTIHGPIKHLQSSTRPGEAWFVDAFVAKLSPSGALLYSTYLGGANLDIGTGIAVDSAGVATVVGYTASLDFGPLTANAYQKEFRPPEDAFLVKLDAAGQKILYATYLGGYAGLEIRPRYLAFNAPSDRDGQNIEKVLKLRSPSSKSVTVIGFSPKPTDSDSYRFINLPAIPFSIPARGEVDITVRCVGCVSNLTDASYRVDAFVEGQTDLQSRSLTFTLIAGDAPPDETVEIEPAVTAGDRGDFASGVALDPAGNAYVAGRFSSLDFPTLAMQRPPVQKTPLFYFASAFAAKFSSDGTLQYSVTLGGSAFDEASGIVVDGTGHAYVVGSTGSPDFPTLDPVQKAIAGVANAFPRGFHADAFLTKLSPAGDPILFSTYLGGAINDFGQAVALDDNGNVYIAGTTFSSDFPVTDGSNGSSRAFQPKFGSVVQPDLQFPSDAFIAKISFGQAPPEIQLWDKLEIAAPTQPTDGPSTFKVEFVRMVGGSEIRAPADVLSVRSNFVTVRVPPALLAPTEVSTQPTGTDPNMRVEVARVATGQQVAQQPLVLRFPQPIIVDELDVRPNSPALRTISQYVLGGPSPNLHTFSFLGRSSDGVVGVRVLNTELRFPAPLRFDTDNVAVFEPEPATARLKLIGTPFHFSDVGPGNQGLRFNVSQNGMYVIAVEASTNSPGPFPARYQLHLVGNVGRPRSLINGVPEPKRGTRLDTLFNHPAPRAQSLLPGDIGVARTALFKFANAASISQFARAVLTPPAGPASGW